MSDRLKRSNPQESEAGIHISPVALGRTILPYHGTIFTARLPQRPFGGNKADISLDSREGVFRGYRGHFLLSDIKLIGEYSVEKVRPGDICRFMVYDPILSTAHSLGERNFFGALILRPVYHSEPTINRLPPELKKSLPLEDNSQTVVCPEDSRAMIGAAYRGDTSFISEVRGNHILQNDLTWLNHRPKNVLLEISESFSRPI